MRWLTCIDDKGLEGLLTYGDQYLVKRVAGGVGGVRVWVDGGGSFVCSASRFSETL